ncbi:hypothetical protein B2G71_04355 [Novosphingobium sp. PC22D]|nr:hypothetical protein B2G71_04355 [Novosphingobium sp. PC22D]
MITKVSLPPPPPEPEPQPTPAEPEKPADLPSPPSPSIAAAKPIIPLDPPDILPLTSVSKSIRLEDFSLKSPAPPRSSTPDSEATYEGLLLARIEQFRRYPRKALRKGEEGVVHIRFHMNREGRVIDAAITQGSGCAALDREALDTLRRAEPLPRIPDDRPEPLEVMVPIEFVLSRAADFQPSVRASKTQG